jgi:hypothetical protein
MIQQLNPATAVSNEATPLQVSRRDGHGGTLRRNHLGQILLRELQCVVSGTVVGHQQPANQTLLCIMDPVAGSRLCEYGGLLLLEFEYCVPEFLEVLKALPQMSGGNPERAAGQLHYAAQWE